MKDTTALSVGRAFLGAATLASGILQLVIGAFVRLVPKLPAWVPAPSALAYVVGVVLIVTGLRILLDRTARAAATLLAAMLVFDVLFLYLPQMIATPGVDRPFLRGYMWTNPLKCLALLGGAAILMGRIPIGAVFLSVFLIVCGLPHFVYADFVLTLVPSWIPPGQRFWTWFTGVALIAGGVGILVPRTARLAAMMSALMIFLWVLLLHIPRALAGPQHAFETAGIFEALALSGVALLVAGNRPGTVAEPRA